MGILDLFRGWRNLSSGKSSPRRRPQAQTTEALEVRQLLSANVVGSVLTVDTTADTTNDLSIAIFQDASGVSVSDDGTGTPQFFDVGTYGVIDTINVITGDGSDIIDIQGLEVGTVFTVDAGLGTNTLASTSSVDANSWVINGVNAGTLNGNTFTNTQNLSGAGLDDSFAFQLGGSLAGQVDGGLGGINTLDYSDPSLVGGITVDLGNLTATGIGAGFVSGSITNLIGSTDTTDTLISDSTTAHNWSITGPNFGNIDGVFDFSSVENLTGGDNDDVFAFSDGGAIDGSVVGGLGLNQLQYLTTNGAVVNLEAGTASGLSGTFSQIQSIVGAGAGTDQVTGYDADSTWDIQGADSGSVTNGSATMDFTNFSNLTGGLGADSFQFQDAGSITGIVGGGGGSNTIDYSQRTDILLVNFESLLATGLGQFNLIDNFIGNGLSDNTIIGANTANTWNITGSDSGNVNGASFSGFANLTGGSSSDSFAFGPGGIVTGAIDGGTGTNTLNYSGFAANVSVDLEFSTATGVGLGYANINSFVGSGTVDDMLIGFDSGSTWNFTGANSGTVTNGSTTATFSEIESHTGGIGNDTFGFAAGGSVSGTLEGNGGTNILNYSGKTTAISVNLQTGAASAVGQGYLNIQGVVGGSSSGDTLTGTNTVNTWNITGPNSGNLNGTFTFSSIENLVGGTLDDTFSVGVSGSLSGSFNGGGGTNIVDFSLKTSPVTVNLAGSSNIQSMVGTSSANDTLVGPDVANTWNILTQDGGNVGGMAFSGFEYLTGGSSTDRFVFAPAGSVRGNIDGAGDVNTLDYSALNVGSVTNLQTRRSTSIGKNFSSIQNVIGANKGDDVLVGANQTNTWEITGANSGTVSSILGTVGFSKIANLTGGVLVDNFRFSPGGSVQGIVDGQNGLNTLDYSLRSDAITVNMQTKKATAIGGIYALIDNVIGNNAANDTIIGLNTGNNWMINGLNSGWVNNGQLTFSNFKNLTGGTGVDVFALFLDGSLTGIAKGGAVANGKDWLDYAGIAADVTADLTLNVATGFAQLVNIQNVHGGTGVNTLTGNATGNILVGGALADNLTAGSGRSLLIGGVGADSVKGGSAQDIVISTATEYDGNLAALSSILSEWQSSASFQTRVARLRTGGGLNGVAVLIADITVSNDVEFDSIFGGTGPNWLWGQPFEFKDKTAADLSDTPIDNRPTLSGATNVLFTVGQLPVKIDPNVVVSDTDSLRMSYATIQIKSNYDPNQDLLAFTPNSIFFGNITGSFNKSTGTMTLTSLGSTATVAQFQAAIRSVTYANLAPPGQLSTSTRTVETIINDGLRSSAALVSQLNINQAPVLANTSTLTYTALQSVQPINTVITVSDADSARLASATIKISTGYNRNQDRLIFVGDPLTTGTIQGVFDIQTGIMTLTSSTSTFATVAQYQAALRLVSYQNIVAAPFKAARVITYVVSDGAANSNNLTSTIKFS